MIKAGYTSKTLATVFTRYCMLDKICNKSEWRLLEEFFRASSRWVTLIGERWKCDKGKDLEYWRVEKVDSVIVLPIYRYSILTVKPVFRPGVGCTTLDFPGGRLLEGKFPVDMVPILLERELSITADYIESVQALNAVKWDVNSSFSNQGLWAFVVQINEDWTLDSSQLGVQVSADERGVAELLMKLNCLQCRAVLLEWYLHRYFQDLGLCGFASNKGLS
jgi:hypothetical protein